MFKYLLVITGLATEAVICTNLNNGEILNYYDIAIEHQQNSIMSKRLKVWLIIIAILVFAGWITLLRFYGPVSRATTPTSFMSTSS